MATKRINLEIHEVSLCKRGANQGAKVVLAKSESDSMTVEELEKQVADLTAERDQIKADLDKATAEPVVIEKTEDKLEKADPEIRALIEKAQAEAVAAREESKAISATLAKAERASLEKSITDRMGTINVVLAGDSEKADMLKAVVDLPADTRDVIFKALEKANTLAVKGTEVLTKEIGSSIPGSTLSAREEVEKKASEIVSKGGITIQKARTMVRDADLELAKREQLELKERK